MAIFTKKLPKTKTSYDDHARRSPPATTSDALDRSPLVNTVEVLNRPPQETSNELKGQLLLDREPQKFGLWADLYRGVWMEEDGHAHIVAIKRLRAAGMESKGPERVERMQKRVLRESSVWSKAKHPHVLPFHGYKFIDEAPCLVSPWCENGNLENYIEAHPDTDFVERLRLLVEAAEGLAYLHGLSPPIIHGDIKPSNIMVTDGIEAAVCDFGISKFAGRSGLTTGNPAFGSRGFMPPEVIMEESDATLEVDVYAFGSLILAVLSGKVPWEGYSTGKYAVAVSLGQKPERKRHPGLPESDPIWDLVELCWATQPADRPTMDQVLSRLREEVDKRRTQHPEASSKEE